VDKIGLLQNASCSFALLHEWSCLDILGWGRRIRKERRGGGKKRQEIRTKDERLIVRATRDGIIAYVTSPSILCVGKGKKKKKEREKRGGRKKKGKRGAFAKATA